jgi:hypothetical protein
VAFEDQSPHTHFLSLPGDVYGAASPVYHWIGRAVNVNIQSAFQYPVYIAQGVSQCPEELKLARVNVVGLVVGLIKEFMGGGSFTPA